MLLLEYTMRPLSTLHVNRLVAQATPATRTRRKTLPVCDLETASTTLA
jgi:hypothetical protein